MFVQWALKILKDEISAKIWYGTTKINHQSYLVWNDISPIWLIINGKLIGKWSIEKSISLITPVSYCSSLSILVWPHLPTRVPICLLPFTCFFHQTHACPNQISSLMGMRGEVRQQPAPIWQEAIENGRRDLVRKGESDVRGAIWAGYPRLSDKECRP